MRWSVLSNELIGKNPLFKIKRDLSSALKSLKKESKIVRIEKSRKNVRYMLTEDTEKKWKFMLC